MNIDEQFDVIKKYWLKHASLKNIDPISQFDSDKFIDNVCLSYKHDFGLMTEQDKQKIRSECKRWMKAISNNGSKT